MKSYNDYVIDTASIPSPEFYMGYEILPSRSGYFVNPRNDSAHSSKMKFNSIIKAMEHINKIIGLGR